MSAIVISLTTYKSAILRIICETALLYDVICKRSIMLERRCLPSGKLVRIFINYDMY